MKAIYSCKLYKASNRKDKIRAAIADPLNAELVTQLRSYLDDDFQDELEEAEAKIKKADVSELQDDDSEANPESNDSSSAGNESHSHISSQPSGSRPSLSEKFDGLMDEDGSDSEDGETTTQDSDVSLDADEIDDESDLQEIDESTNIPSSELEDHSNCLSNVVDEVRSLLNTDENTQGINRVLVKDNELWIYYNDSINLNNVMGPAIEKLSSSGYDYLDFNRLARSDNAIVFQNNAKDSKCLHEEDLDV